MSFISAAGDVCTLLHSNISPEITEKKNVDDVDAANEGNREAADKAPCVDMTAEYFTNYILNILEAI